jgi:hypothetical protein
MRLSEALGGRGWANLEGWEGGCLYAKVQVERSIAAIVETAEAAKELCARHGAEILLIDADTSPDVEHSTFVTLYRFPS